MPKKFSIKERIKSIGFGLTGIRTFFKEEHNAYVHLVAACMAIGLGFYWDIDRTEWSLIVLCIGLVFAAEVFNTSIEAFANHVQPNRHKDIEKVKDLAAAGVLIVSFMALLIGLLIFLPKMGILN